MDIKQKILEYLASVPDKWAHSSQIAQAVGNNRVTIAKYLDVLKAEGQVQMKVLGKAKLWSLAEPKQPIILVVDDEPHILQLIKLSLGKKFHFLEARNGEEALERVRQQVPDLILLDIMMPKLDGFGVIEQLKSHVTTQHIPVIFLSAKGQVEDKAKGLQLGADEYITKPFNPLELEARVVAILKKQDTLKQRNPISGLPENMQIKAYLSNTALQDKNIIHIKVQHLPESNAAFGFKQGTEMIQFLSKLFTHVLESHKYFIGHYNTNHFVIVVPKNVDIVHKIQEQFSQSLPFLYTNSELIEKEGEMYVKTNEQTILAISLHITTIDTEHVFDQLKL